MTGKVSHRFGQVTSSGDDRLFRFTGESIHYYACRTTMRCSDSINLPIYCRWVGDSPMDQGVYYDTHVAIVKGMLAFPIVSSYTLDDDGVLRRICYSANDFL